jgi:D-alanyl-D-alanine carboxypeptidase (penicillin-binding protein 5/6)
MEVYSFKKISLPNIHSDVKAYKSEHGFFSTIKDSNVDTEGVKVEDSDSSFNDDLVLPNFLDNENKNNSNGSTNSSTPTTTTSKHSMAKLHLRKPVRVIIRNGTKKGRHLHSSHIPSDSCSIAQDPPSTQRSGSSYGKNVSGLKALLKEFEPPKISAKCWTVINAKTGEFLANKRGNKKREIASLTKMMTCLCSCKLIEKFNIDPKNVYIQVSKFASKIGGTSAELQRKDVLSIWDLLHGLMLPSGNDAALSLAESFGSYIYLKSERCRVRTEMDSDHPNKKVKNPIKYFLHLMNQTAHELGLKNTFYSNPHGLFSHEAHSTAIDQAKLTHHLLQWKIIMEIVNKKEYQCEIEQVDKTVRIAKWENTNKLLGRKGWHGVKTGVTVTAGPSLSAYYENGQDAYIIVLLNSSSKEIRWIEAIKLVEWAIKFENSKKSLLQ